MTNPPSFKSLNEVLRHLQDSEYSISKSAIYRHKDAGKIRIEDDGSVLEAEVRAYAATHLEKDIVATVEDAPQLQAEKVELEKQKLKEQIAKLKFSRERDEGLYVPADEVDQRMVGIIMVLDTNFRQLIDLTMTDICSKLEGNVKRVNDARDFFEQELDEMMNRLSRTDQFSIQFQATDEVEP